MDKESFYNIVFEHQGGILVFNTFSDSMLYLTKEEFEEVKLGLRDLAIFSKDYPRLYKGMKKAGFIINEDFDELAYIKLMNHIRIYGNTGIHLTVNPTLDCNLNCWYCSTEYAKAVHKGSMSDRTINALNNHIKRLVKENKTPSLHLDWFGGEPLMFFDKVIVPIASYAYKVTSENNVKFTQHITTNASLMNEEMIKMMKKLHFTSYQITLDGNETRHDFVKHKANGDGTFKTVIRNINLLADNIPNVEIILRINYDRKTLYGIKDIIPMFSENAKKHIVVDFQKVWQVNCKTEDFEQLKIIKHLFDENGLHSGFWAYSPRPFNRCYADRLNHYAINYDGKVFKCTAQDYGEDKAIGVLHDDGSISWNFTLLSKLFAYSTFENENCLKCKVLPLCFGPCIMRNFDARKNHSQIPCNVIDEARRRGLLV